MKTQTMCPQRLMFAAVLLIVMSFTAHAQKPSPLFICETNQNGKYLAVYGVENGPDDPWTDIQYQFGPEEGALDMVYPDDPSKGAKLIFFSHEYVDRGRNNYLVSIRFVNAGYTYKIFSYSGRGGAGVRVFDSKGKERSVIACIERPYMFPSYLQRSLACDMKNPHGRAACQDAPYKPR